jgi:hypothetical protein
MATFTWIGNGSGNWSVAANWSPAGGPPDTGTDAAVLTGGTSAYAVAILGPITVGDVLLNDPLATLDVNAGLVLAGDITGNGTVDVGGGATLAVTASVSGITLGFVDLSNGKAAEIDLAQPNSVTAPIQNLEGFDTVDLQGFFLTGTSYVNDVLTLTNAIGSVTIDVVPRLPDLFFPAQLLVSEDDAGDTTVTVRPAPCFLRGTRIATPSGWAAVESLRPGDLVTLAGGGTAPVVWIAHRGVACDIHPRPKQVWPVRILRDAFGPGEPCRDLYLSPDHAVFAEDVLIPVKHLLNGSSVTQEPFGSVEYFHVELPRHDVLLAEGLPVESFLDIGDRSCFDNAGVVVAAFPDFSLIWEAAGCAPLCVTGAAVDAVRDRLRRRVKVARPGGARTPVLKGVRRGGRLEPEPSCG